MRNREKKETERELETLSTYRGTSGINSIPGAAERERKKRGGER